MTRYKLFFMAFLAFVSHAALADLLIEPVIGFNFAGKFEAANVTPTESKNTSGAGYGGRLGYQNLGFQLGLDYLHSTLDVQSNNSNLKMTEYGGFVGFKFPILFRVYAGYTFAADGSISSVDYKKGSGAKLGVGFTGLPFININVEYRTTNFSEYETGGVTTSKDSKFHTMFIGLSLPFAI